MTEHALVLLDGEPSDRTVLDRTWPGWADGLDLVIAADGGARHAAALGVNLDRWVGDGDSIEPEALADLAAAGVALDRAPADKDESDAELAVLAAVAAAAGRITILGAFGGPRLDHGLANLGLLGHPALAGREVRVVDERTRVRLVGPGDHDLGGRVGDTVSLLPFGGPADGVTTSGLRYPLGDEPLPVGPARGLSNVRVAADASVRLRDGRLLVIESPATLGR